MGSLFCYHLPKGENNMSDAVCSLKAQSYDYGEIKSVIDRQSQLLELDRLIRPGMKIVIKPNLLMKRTPEEATTTHPTLVAAVTEHLLKLGAASVTVAESPGGLYSKGQLTGIYNATGMTAYSKSHGFHLNDDFSFTEVPFPEGEASKLFNIITPLTNADLIISIAKLKTHGMTGLSGAVKNMFGSVPGLQKPELHYRFPDKMQFCNMLIDLWECVHPAITFVDAVESMEGNGPSGGNSRKTDRIFCSTDPYALDMALAYFIDMPISQIPVLQNAIRRGLAPKDFSQVTMLGDPVTPIPDFKKPHQKSIDFLDRLPRRLQQPAKKAADRLLAPRPVVRTRDCVGCGKCAESCPQKIIRVENHKAKIHPESCIRCYCCHEMCPVKAIDIKRFRFFSV